MKSQFIDLSKFEGAHEGGTTVYFPVFSLEVCNCLLVGTLLHSLSNIKCNAVRTLIFAIYTTKSGMAFCLYSISILLEYGLVSILVRTVMSCIQRNFIRRPCNWTKKDPAIWFLSIMHMLGALCLRIYRVIRQMWIFIA